VCDRERVRGERAGNKKREGWGEVGGREENNERDRGGGEGKEREKEREKETEREKKREKEKPNCHV